MHGVVYFVVYARYRFSFGRCDNVLLDIRLSSIYRRRVLCCDPSSCVIVTEKTRTRALSRGALAFERIEKIPRPPTSIERCTSAARLLTVALSGARVLQQRTPSRASAIHRELDFILRVSDRRVRGGSIRTLTCRI